jgi:hypothetical protein
VRHIAQLPAARIYHTSIDWRPRLSVAPTCQRTLGRSFPSSRLAEREESTYRPHLPGRLLTPIGGRTAALRNSSTPLAFDLSRSTANSKQV